MTRKRKYDRVGWFTRTVRETIEPIWDRQYIEHGKVNRWEARDEAWEDVQENVGLPGIVSMARGQHNQGEGQVLASNQAAFRKALKRARAKLSSQSILPFSAIPAQNQIDAVKQEVHTELFSIRRTYLRRPGPDQDFSELIQVRDLDFDVIYDMVVVRTEKQHESELSKEDYDFLDSVRRALKASNTATLGELFDLPGDQEQKSA